MKQYDYYKDSIATWREGVRGGAWVRDEAITATGFSGTEGVDWENRYSSEE